MYVFNIMAKRKYTRKSDRSVKRARSKRQKAMRRGTSKKKKRISDKALKRSRKQQKKSRRRGKTLRGGASNDRPSFFSPRRTIKRKRTRPQASARRAASGWSPSQLQRLQERRAASLPQMPTPAEAAWQAEETRREVEEIAEELATPTGEVERFARGVFTAPVADARERVTAARDEARRRVSAAGDAARRQIAVVLTRMLEQTGSLSPDAWLRTSEGLERARELAAATAARAEGSRQDLLDATRRAAQV